MQRFIKKIYYYFLLLYYTAVAKSTPSSQKAVIFGALAYFFLPLDLIPDALPIVGFTDDLGALIAGTVAVVESLTPEIKEKAKNKSNTNN